MIDKLSSILEKPAAGMSIIEVLLAIAILTIGLYAAYAVLAGSQKALGYTDKKFAAVNLARIHMEEIERTQFSSLPPEEIVVPGEAGEQHGLGRYVFQLHQPNIVDGSVLVKCDDVLLPSADYSVDYNLGQLSVEQKYAGKLLTVDYKYQLVKKSECLNIPAQAPFSVKLLESAKPGSINVTFNGAAIQPMRISCESGRLEFGAGDAGKKVYVEYEGTLFHALVGGRFRNLNSSDDKQTDRQVKEMTLEESWKDGVRRHMTFACLRTR